MKLGFHVSISGSLDQSIDRALEIGCTTFQMFTRNPRTWKAKPITKADAEAFREKLKVSGIHPVYSHMPYIPNLASSDEEIYRKSVDALLLERERCRLLSIPYIVTHLGSHEGAGSDKGETQLIQALGQAADDDGPIILLENSSGSGGHIGAKLPEISRIIKEVGSQNIGVCFDTCHAFAAGYDVSHAEGLKKTMSTIRKTISFSQLKLVHLNDSLGDIESGIDHHEHIGMGKIGESGFKLILRSQLAKRPLIMETPIDERRSNKENLVKTMELAGINM